MSKPRRLGLLYLHNPNGETEALAEAMLSPHQLLPEGEWLITLLDYPDEPSICYQADLPEYWQREIRDVETKMRSSV